MNRALISISALGFGLVGFACSDTDGPGDTSGAGGAVDGGIGSGGNVVGAGGSDNVIGAGGGGNVIGAGGGGNVIGSGGGGNVIGAGGGGNVIGAGGAVEGAGGAVEGAGGAVEGAGGTVDGAGGAPPVPEPSLVTSGPNGYWQVGEVTEGGGTASITVDDSDVKQDWHGFGGTFNEKGWDALKAISEADRDVAIQLLFSATDGAGFTFGRIPIGSSDYGLDRYSLNETAGDFTMENFSIDRDKKDLIPYIKAALAVKPNIRFWGSPWSPPTWMKDNGAFDRGNMKTDAQTLDAHALYLARFVEEYEKEGIHVEAVHPQNEPGYPQDYPSCQWSGSLMANYIGNHLGPLFAERLPDTEVWLGTMSNEGSTSIVSAVMGDATASGYVKGIGLQWGQEGSASGYTRSYSVPIMQTEHRCGNYPWEGSYQQVAPNDHAYAVESWGLFKGWINAGVNSYLAWNMVLDTGGRSLDDVRPWSQNALLIVDRNAGALIATPTYYVFRHLAQYVEPGSVRVGVSGDALAWKNPDGSIVTIIYSQGGGATTLAVGGTTVSFDIPASGWATVNWQG